MKAIILKENLRQHWKESLYIYKRIVNFVVYDVIRVIELKGNVLRYKLGMCSNVPFSLHKKYLLKVSENICFVSKNNNINEGITVLDRHVSIHLILCTNIQ